MSGQPKVVMTAFGELLESVYPKPVRAELESFAEVTYNDLGRKLTEEELIGRVGEAEACLTTWGSPSFTPEVIAAAPKLKIIAHAAGSVRALVSPAAYERGIVVTSAAPVIARYVGEMALMLTLALLRDLPRHDRALKEEGAWEVAGKWAPDTLRERKVGLIGFGLTGREFAGLLEPFKVELLCYDPHVAEEEVAKYGGRRATVEEILKTCDVISVHAASIPATRNMLDRERLAMIKDGAVFVNTARGSVIEMEALVEELKKGRWRAALDVFDPEEPLPADHPLRSLPNVILTPHVSGPVKPRYWEMGKQAVENVRIVLEGGTPGGAVSKQQLETMA